MAAKGLRLAAAEGGAAQDGPRNPSPPAKTQRARQLAGPSRFYPVNRRSASRYFSLVFCRTSGGSFGPGAFLFQSRVSR